MTFMLEQQSEAFFVACIRYHNRVVYRILYCVEKSDFNYKVGIGELRYCFLACIMCNRDLGNFFL